MKTISLKIWASLLVIIFFLLNTASANQVSPWLGYFSLQKWIQLACFLEKRNCFQMVKISISENSNCIHGRDLQKWMVKCIQAGLLFHKVQSTQTRTFNIFHMCLLRGHIYFYFSRLDFSEGSLHKVFSAPEPSSQSGIAYRNAEHDAQDNYLRAKRRHWNCGGD